MSDVASNPENELEDQTIMEGYSNYDICMIMIS
jgi:hypothetical protein